MKHCAKKLLGLAFALALCLAVGGTAFAVEAPEFADVLAALPEQEMMDYEANVTAEPGTTSTGELERDGYTVTIPTTVEVKSGENNGKPEVKGELEVTAVMKQWRTLLVEIAPQTPPTSGAWTLKYNGNASADTTLPQVEYNLPSGYDGSVNELGNPTYEWIYDGSYKHLSFTTPKLGGSEDLSKTKTITAKLAVTVPHPEQATMSGTYSDILTFKITPDKTCVTYNINIYKQKLVLNKDGWHNNGYSNYQPVNAVNVYNETTGNVEAGATPDETVTLEYSSGDATTHTWTRPRPTDDAEEDERCWENLSYTLTPKTDYDADNKTRTINLNLVRKWYWLDVNGATDYAGGDEDIHGNQGGSISGCVNMKVSVDGNDWTPWFWQSDGDDYWGQLPYGIHFKLGLHHVKNGYVYEMSGNGVRIIANKQDTVTDSGTKERGISGFYTTYYVYENTLTGQWTDIDNGKKRYCYIPCYKKGITYFANDGKGGTGGKEDVNEDNPPRSNVPYDATGTLKTPAEAELDIHAPTGKSFAGWSTSADYPTTGELYKPGDNVRDVHWDTYTPAEMGTRPTGDNQKRELYAIWGYKTNIKIAFEDGLGTTDKNALGVFETVQKGNFVDEYTLKTDKIVIPGQTLTLDLNDSDVKAAITAGTDAVKSDPLYNGVVVTDDKIWDLAQTYTITVPQNKTATLRFEILRKRYLLNVMAVLAPNGTLVTLPTDAATPAKYGTFCVNCNGRYQTVGGKSKFSVYQLLRNYGSTYEVCKVEANPGYQFVKFMIPAGQGVITAGDSTHITGILTGKNENLSYFGGDGKTYTGDTIYVVFKPDMVTFDFNGGTTKDGETSTKERYNPGAFIPQMSYNSPGTSSLLGWSLNKEKKPNETIYKPDSTRLGDISWSDPENKVLYARWSTGPNRAPAKKALTVRYHANFDPMEELALDLDPNPLLEDMDEDFGFEPEPLPEDVLDPTVDAVKTVTYKPDENVVLRHCMFKRAGYVFVGWNTEPDGTGKKYEVNGVPITDWAAGATVDLYAQWEKPHHLKPVVDGEPQPGGATPAPTPQPGGADATPAPQPGGVDDAFGIDPHLGGMDDAFGVDPAAQPEGLDDAFGVDPADQPKALDDAFGIDPDPQPEELDDAFGV